MRSLRRLLLCAAACVFATFQALPPAHAQGGLLEAARANDRVAMLDLLAAGADATVVDAHGTSALHWAAMHDEPELVSRLLEAGANPGARNDYGSTPLAEAALVGSAAVLEMLLEAGVEPDSANEYGQTPLMVVARAANVEAAEVLLRYGADVGAREQLRGQTALMWAVAYSHPEVSSRHPEMVRLLVDSGAAVNDHSRAHNWERQISAEARALYRHAGGLTPLLFAARQGCLECARILIEAGADLELSDPEGGFALLFAITNLHFDLAAYLLDAGAQVNRWDWYGRTPLYAAVDMNTLPAGRRPDRPPLGETTSLDLIERLLVAGADPNAQLKLRPLYRSTGDRGCDNMITIGTTPLLRAAKVFDTDAMELLIAHGADVNQAQFIGISPVMAAAGLGSWDCDSRGKDIYQRADVQSRAVRALERLLDAGADVHATIDFERGRYCCPVDNLGQSFNVLAGQTPLHGAAFWGWDDVVAYLVQRGANLHAKDARGMTPLDAALGRAGGNGLYGQRIDVHEGTAALIERLLGGASVSVVGQP